MSNQTPPTSRWLSFGMTLIAAAAALTIGVFGFTELPQRYGIIESTRSNEADPSEDDHAGHQGHDHAGHEAGESIELSRQARANLGLKTQIVAVGPYTRYVEVPGVVTGWPGMTHVSVASPLTGVINAISVLRGELIESGTPLFTLRLTHQDLVNTQETFLAQLGQLDVEKKEIRRLASISSSGAIARKNVLAREYERDKLMAGIRAAKQSMLLHGLSEDQIRKIERDRTLIREVVVHAPMIHADNSLHHESLGDAHDRLTNSPSLELATMQPQPTHPHEHIDTDFLVTELDVRRGETVMAGQQMAQLSDYSRLLIEGQAYQRDGDLLRRAADTKAEIRAVMESSGDRSETIADLKVVYISNEIRQDSRSLPFYVELVNKIERSETRGTKRYISWRYKPGQRLTVLLPVSKIDNAIVVPKDAVAEEGLERYLFVENGDHFDRVPVEVVARDSINTAIKNDGQVWPGQTIASSGAHQLQMAMKNQSGGAIDPHAGHHH